MFRTGLMIFLNELRMVFRVREVSSVLIVGLVTYFFFYPVPYNNEEVRNVPIAVLDQDHTTMSRDYLRKIDASDALRITEHIDNLAEGKEMIKRRDVYGIVMIPFNFEKNILSGKQESVVFYGDASYVMIFNAMSSAVTAITQSVNQSILTNKQIQMGVDPSIAQSNSTAFTPVLVQTFNPQVGYETYVVPPAYVLILHQSIWLGIMIACVLSRRSNFDIDLMEKQDYSLTQLTGITLFSKYIAYLFYGIIAFFIYILSSGNFYQLPQLASIINLGVIGFIFISTIIFMAIALSNFFGKIDTIFIMILPLSMFIFFLSGISWPMHLFPKLFVYLSHLIPATSAMTGVVKMNQMGASLEQIMPELMNLIVLLIIFACGAYYGTYRYLRSLRN